MKTAQMLKRDMRRIANPQKAKITQSFFKTKPGEYGHGDVFWGITVPQSRILAKTYNDLPSSEIKRVLRSPVHEMRLVALLILIRNFQNQNKIGKRQIYSFYIKNIGFVNNWDLVDLSADKIVGSYLQGKSKKILYAFAKSKNIWQRRIAIIATFHFIKQNQFNETLKISKILLRDDHDLIQKAVGWMLREIGKRSLEKEEEFLRVYYHSMPRTMLRYAIERFPRHKRKHYLS